MAQFILPVWCPVRRTLRDGSTRACGKRGNKLFGGRCVKHRDEAAAAEATARSQREFEARGG